ncbi:MAG: hypothetical protein K0R80_125 [Clostridia bacterium]|nr:hypothetical protein [Clostridia bacterium]
MYICPECGAHLDPGEKCDCDEGAEIAVQDTLSIDNEK